MRKCYHGCLRLLVGIVFLLAVFGLCISQRKALCGNVSLTKDQSKRPDIEFKVERLNQDEQCKLFGKSSKFLFDSSLNDPLVLLRLYVKNNSDNQCVLNPKDFQINCLGYSDVIRDKRIKIGASWGKSLGIGFAIVGSIIGGIFSGIGFSIRASVINARMKKHLANNTIFSKKVVVDAGDEYSGLMLVKQSEYSQILMWLYTRQLRVSKYDM